MTQEKINERITSILRDAEPLEETVCAMDAADPEQEYGRCHADAVRWAEWLTCRLRHLLYETTSIRKHDYLLRAAETLGIRFCDRDGIFQITLPGIVFDDNMGHPTEFLYDPLYCALYEYFSSHSHA